MDTKQYLDRINYSGNLEPSLEVLGELQKNHLLNVPFENLDIHYGTPIELNIDSIYKKIIVNRRGGFCYELNGLFYELLIALGFDARRVSARVFKQKHDYGAEYDHLAIIVNFDEKEFLSDVGFGELTFGPLEIKLNKLQKDKRGDFLIDMHDNEYFRVNKMENGVVVPEYIFKNMEREFEEFQGMCHYHQTNPKSHFTQKRLISIPTQNGRITITDDILKITKNDAVQEKTSNDEAAFEQWLWHYFKIKIAN